MLHNSFTARRLIKKLWGVSKYWRDFLKYLSQLRADSSVFTPGVKPLISLQPTVSISLKDTWPWTCLSEASGNACSDWPCDGCRSMRGGRKARCLEKDGARLKLCKNDEIFKDISSLVSKCTIGVQWHHEAIQSANDDSYIHFWLSRRLFASLADQFFIYEITAKKSIRFLLLKVISTILLK